MGRIVNIRQLRGSIIRRIERERGVTINRSTGVISKKRSSSSKSTTTTTPTTKTVSFAGVRSPAVEQAIVQRMTERGDVITSGRGRTQQQEILRQQRLRSQGYSSELQATAYTYTPMSEGYRQKLATAEQEAYLARGIEAQRRQQQVSTSQAIASRMGGAAQAPKEEKKYFDTRGTYTAAEEPGWLTKLERYRESKELEGGQLAGFTAFGIGAFTGTVRLGESLLHPIETLKGLGGVAKKTVTKEGREEIMQTGYEFGQNLRLTPGGTIGEIAGPAALSYGVSKGISYLSKPKVIGSTEKIAVKAITTDLPGDEQLTKFTARGKVDVTTKSLLGKTKTTQVGVDAKGFEMFSQPKLKSMELMKTSFKTGDKVVKGDTAAVNIFKQADGGYTFQKYAVTKIDDIKDVFSTKGFGGVKTSPKLLGEVWPADPASSMIGTTSKGKSPLNILRQQTFKVLETQADDVISSVYLQRGATVTKQGMKYGDIQGFYYPKPPTSPGTSMPGTTIKGIGGPLQGIQKAETITKSPIVTTKQFTQQAEKIVQSTIPKAKGIGIPVISSQKAVQKTSQVPSLDVSPQPRKPSGGRQRPYSILSYDTSREESISRRTAPSYDIMTGQRKRTAGGSKQRPRQIQYPEVVQQPTQVQMPRQLTTPRQITTPRQQVMPRMAPPMRGITTPGYPNRRVIIPPINLKFYMPRSRSGLSVPKTRSRYQVSIYASQFQIKTPKSIAYSGVLRGILPSKKRRKKRRR